MQAWGREFDSPFLHQIRYNLLMPDERRDIIITSPRTDFPLDGIVIPVKGFNPLSKPAENTGSMRAFRNGRELPLVRDKNGKLYFGGHAY